MLQCDIVIVPNQGDESNPRSGVQACKEGVPDLSFGPSTIASPTVLPDLQDRCSVMLDQRKHCGDKEEMKR